MKKRRLEKNGRSESMRTAEIKGKNRDRESGVSNVIGVMMMLTIVIILAAMVPSLREILTKTNCPWR